MPEDVYSALKIIGFDVFIQEIKDSLQNSDLFSLL